MSFLTTWTNGSEDKRGRFRHVINARSFVPLLFDCTQSRLCPLDRMRTRVNAVPHCRQTRSGFLAKRCFLRVSSSQRPPFGCSDQNYAHVSTGHRERGRPDSIVSRETRTHVAEAPRAHRTRMQLDRDVQLLQHINTATGGELLSGHRRNHRRIRHTICS